MEIGPLDGDDSYVGLLGFDWHTHADLLTDAKTTSAARAIFAFILGIFQGDYLLVERSKNGVILEKYIEEDPGYVGMNVEEDEKEIVCRVDKPELTIGFFPEFHDPTLLLWGTRFGLLKLAGFFASLSKGVSGQVLLSDLSWVEARKGLKVSIAIDENGDLITQNGRHCFDWKMTSRRAYAASEIIEGVAWSEKPCHNCFDDVAPDDLTLMVSKGEYDDLRS